VRVDRGSTGTEHVTLQHLEAPTEFDPARLLALLAASMPANILFEAGANLDILFQGTGTSPPSDIILDYMYSAFLTSMTYPRAPIVCSSIVSPTLQTAATRCNGRSHLTDVITLGSIIERTNLRLCYCTTTRGLRLSSFGVVALLGTSGPRQTPIQA
jgi:hypothetical protein